MAVRIHTFENISCCQNPQCLGTPDHSIPTIVTFLVVRIPTDWVLLTIQVLTIRTFLIVRIP